MVNHPNRNRLYRVQPIPNASDVRGESHFAVRGPRIEEYAICESLADVMQRALNIGRRGGPHLTPEEKHALSLAARRVLADEHDWSDVDLAALHRAQAKLDG
jgi:hypothetical protein